ncbi:MAG TPA: twin-arginine translocation signal domain-containing protein, partial [Terriglobia bacterium]|nr:twin-arginine translocation signal domain-containing protein [Terriglobia bacterium]
MAHLKTLTRRDFITAAATAVAAASLPASNSPLAPTATGRRRYAIVGTGDRGSGMWGRSLAPRYSDVLEFVGLCDPNPKRAAASKDLLGVSSPTFTSFDEMC